MPVFDTFKSAALAVLILVGGALHYGPVKAGNL